ncbi:MAG: hypothetical protein EOM06_09700 [Sphingobacteriia bacterium]|nr:hypothetical protein [Sphingobacteriia bacterium]
MLKNIMQDQLTRLLKTIRLSNPGFVFLLSLLIFFADSVINYFVRIPLFVSWLMLLLPLLWLEIWSSGRKSRFLFIFVLIFLISFLINLFLRGFYRNNLSDLVFILAFPTAYYYYQTYKEKLGMDKIQIFLVIVVLMFSFTFFGVNSTNNNRSQEIKSEYSTELKRVIKDPQSKWNHLETNRLYHWGLFRIPHIAAYFMGYLMFFYGLLYQQQKKIRWLILSLVLLFFMFYSGVRTYIVASAFACFFYLLKKKYWITLSASTCLVLLMLLFRIKLHELTVNTFLHPFTASMITLVDNFDKFSRVLIWRSWWIGFSSFEWHDLMIGKSFLESMLTNLNHLHLGEWFHNDFLSIAFSYGIPALFVYLIFLIKIYLDNSKEIRRHVILFLAFWSFIFSAFINGGYYYFPVFYLFIFLIMIRMEREKTHKTIAVQLK